MAKQVTSTFATHSKAKFNLQLRRLDDDATIKPCSANCASSQEYAVRLTGSKAREIASVQIMNSDGNWEAIFNSNGYCNAHSAYYISLVKAKNTAHTYGY
jgi:hypothetical protein